MALNLFKLEKLKIIQDIHAERAEQPHLNELVSGDDDSNEPRS